eukprot:SAG22_NODE_4229_length_1333_cov_2.483793_2_plen_78_part_00
MTVGGQPLPRPGGGSDEPSPDFQKMFADVMAFKAEAAGGQLDRPGRLEAASRIAASWGLEDGGGGSGGGSGGDSSDE